MHPQKMRETYLHAFNIKAWDSLTQTQKQEHTLTNCEACRKKYADLSTAFPIPVKKKRKVLKISNATIKLSKGDLCSTKTLGGKILTEFTNISQKAFTKQHRWY